MAYIQTEAEDTIRGNGDNALRTLQRNIRPVVCSFAEAKVHHNGIAAARGGTPLPYVSREDRALRTRADARDDNEPDPFADWQNSEPLTFPAGRDNSDKQAWFLIGKSVGKAEQFEKLMPAISAAIERASR